MQILSQRGESALILGAEGGCGEQLGPVAKGLLQALSPSPAADGVVIATTERMGNGGAAKGLRPGVVRVVEQTAAAMGGAGNAVELASIMALGGTEAFVAGRVWISENAWQQTDDGIDDDGGAELSAREDVVADRDLVIAEQIADALVDPLIAAADEDDAIEGREVVRHRLGERSAPGGEQENLFAMAMALFGKTKRLYGAEDGFGLEHHAFAAAVGPIVDRAVAIFGEATQIEAFDGNQTPLDGSTKDAEAERAREEVGKDRDQVEAHGRLQDSLTLGRNAFAAVWRGGRVRV